MPMIAQVTDCHLFGDISKTGYNDINPFDSLSQVLSDVASHQPDVLLVTGDISGDDSQQSYVNFLTLVEQHGLSAKLKVIAGNHDNSANFEQYLAKYDLVTCGPLVINGWMLHGVDTRHEGTLGLLETHQLATLKQNIERHLPYNHLIACHHHPLSVSGWMDKHAFVNKSAFVDLLTAQQQVKGVVYGHIHGQKRDRLAHIAFAACPSSCWQFSQTDNFGTTKQPPGFNIIRLGLSGELDISTLRINQEQFTTP